MDWVEVLVVISFVVTGIQSTSLELATSNELSSQSENENNKDRAFGADAEAEYEEIKKILDENNNELEILNAATEQYDLSTSPDTINIKIDKVLAQRLYNSFSRFVEQFNDIFGKLGDRNWLQKQSSTSYTENKRLNIAREQYDSSTNDCAQRNLLGSVKREVSRKSDKSIQAQTQFDSKTEEGNEEYLGEQDVISKSHNGDIKNEEYGYNNSNLKDWMEKNTSNHEFNNVSSSNGSHIPKESSVDISTSLNESEDQYASEGQLKDKIPHSPKKPLDIDLSRKTGKSNKTQSQFDFNAEPEDGQYVDEQDVISRNHSDPNLDDWVDEYTSEPEFNNVSPWKRAQLPEEISSSFEESEDDNVNYHYFPEWQYPSKPEDKSANPGRRPLDVDQSKSSDESSKTRGQFDFKAEEGDGEFMNEEDVISGNRNSGTKGIYEEYDHNYPNSDHWVDEYISEPKLDRPQFPEKSFNKISSFFDESEDEDVDYQYFPEWHYPPKSKYSNAPPSTPLNAPARSFDQSENTDLNKDDREDQNSLETEYNDVRSQPRPYANMDDRKGRHPSKREHNNIRNRPKPNTLKRPDIDKSEDENSKNQYSNPSMGKQRGQNSFRIKYNEPRPMQRPEFPRKPLDVSASSSDRTEDRYNQYANTNMNGQKNQYPSKTKYNNVREWKKPPFSPGINKSENRARGHQPNYPRKPWNVPVRFFDQSRNRYNQYLDSDINHPGNQYPSKTKYDSVRNWKRPTFWKRPSVLPGRYIHKSTTRDEKYQYSNQGIKKQKEQLPSEPEYNNFRLQQKAHPSREPFDDLGDFIEPIDKTVKEYEYPDLVIDEQIRPYTSPWKGRYSPGGPLDVPIDFSKQKTINYKKDQYSTSKEQPFSMIQPNKAQQWQGPQVPGELFDVPSTDDIKERPYLPEKLFDVPGYSFEESGYENNISPWQRPYPQEELVDDSSSFFDQIQKDESLLRASLSSSSQIKNDDQARYDRNIRLPQRSPSSKKPFDVPQRVFQDFDTNKHRQRPYFPRRPLGPTVSLFDQVRDDNNIGSWKRPKVPQKSFDAPKYNFLDRSQNKKNIHFWHKLHRSSSKSIKNGSNVFPEQGPGFPRKQNNGTTGIFDQKTSNQKDIGVLNINAKKRNHSSGTRKVSSQLDQYFPKEVPDDFFDRSTNTNKARSKIRSNSPAKLLGTHSSNNNIIGLGQGPDFLRRPFEISNIFPLKNKVRDNLKLDLDGSGRQYLSDSLYNNRHPGQRPKLPKILFYISSNVFDRGTTSEKANHQNLGMVAQREQHSTKSQLKEPQYSGKPQYISGGSSKHFRDNDDENQYWDLDENSQMGQRFLETEWQRPSLGVEPVGAPGELFIQDRNYKKKNQHSRHFNKKQISVLDGSFGRDRIYDKKKHPWQRPRSQRKPFDVSGTLFDQNNRYLKLNTQAQGGKYFLEPKYNIRPWQTSYLKNNPRSLSNRYEEQYMDEPRGQHFLEEDFNDINPSKKPFDAHNSFFDSSRNYNKKYSHSNSDVNRAERKQQLKAGNKNSGLKQKSSLLWKPFIISGGRHKANKINPWYDLLHKSSSTRNIPTGFTRLDENSAKKVSYRPELDYSLNIFSPLKEKFDSSRNFFDVVNSFFKQHENKKRNNQNFDSMKNTDIGFIDDGHAFDVSQKPGSSIRNSWYDMLKGDTVGSRMRQNQKVNSIDPDMLLGLENLRGLSDMLTNGFHNYLNSRNNRFNHNEGYKKHGTATITIQIHIGDDRR